MLDGNGARWENVAYGRRLDPEAVVLFQPISV